MKVLIAYPNNKSMDNPFVRTLKHGLEDAGCNISWGLNEFWNYTSKYDIVHIQWPDSLFVNWSPTDLEVLFLGKHINEIKKHAKIVYTRHNEVPHIQLNPNKKKCYDIIEKNADAIVHLGNYGIDTLKEKLQNYQIKHFVIPHHIYENEYDNSISQQEARTRLNIPLRKFVILTFGTYRNAEEVHMVLDEYKKMKIKHKYLLAPRLRKTLINEAKKKHILKWIKDRIVLLKFKIQGISMGNDFVSDDKVSYYFAASDIVLIQRLNIMNSGNVSMAFYFSKPVVGANVGNMGDLLIKTNNYVFNPYEKDALCKAIYNIKKNQPSSTGDENYKFAMRFLNLKTVATQYIEVYKSLL
jgi:glycosyltransferase involved in cell wall biosynthesis